MKKRLIREAEEEEEVEVKVTDDATSTSEATPEEISKEIAAMSNRDFNKLVDTIARDNSLSKIEKMMVVIDLYKHARKEMQYRSIGKVLGVSHQGAINIEQRALKKLRKAMAQAGFHSYEDFTGND